MKNTEILPQWIAKMYPSKGGRDHLGLGSVSSDQILPALSPSINVLTYHPRYHSFYVFLLDEFWRRERPRSTAEWKRFFRPRDLIFSVGANLCQQPEHGDMRNIVGGRKTGPLAGQRLDKYDTSYHYIESSFGGYGLYYYTVMIEMGLLYPGGKGMPYPIEVPTQKGKEVAEAFRESVRETQYYQSYFYEDETQVPLEVIQEYIHKACLCQLRTPSASDRTLVRDVFLHGGPEHAARSRRSTFQLFLDIANQTTNIHLDQGTFRQILYFRETESGVAYAPKENVIRAYKQWRLYQAREYYTFALNALWFHLCDWGIDRHGDIHPILITDLWEYLDQVLDFDSLANILELPPPSISSASGFVSLLKWIQDIVGADVEHFDSACTISSPINEHRLHRLAYEYTETPEIMVAGMITMLALIYLRFGKPELWLQPEWFISQMGENGRLSLDRYLKTLQRKLNNGPVTISEISRWLYSDYVILQHQLVANSKLPDNTFRFYREGQRLRFFNLSNPLNFMDSRFESISTTIHELGFCGDLSLPGHEITSAGKKLLGEGDLG